MVSRETRFPDRPLYGMLGELLAQKEDAEVALRQAVRCPELWTEPDRKWWQRQWQGAVGQLESLEWELDLFTYDKFERQRFQLWLRESGQG
jgi:hypothetical protein